MTNEKLHANKAVISHFISAITGNWSNSSKEVGLFEIRCLGEKRTTKPKRFSLDTIDDAVDFATRMNAQKFNIYMVINPIRMDAEIEAGNGATDEDILQAHYSFADADDEKGPILIAQRVLEECFGASTSKTQSKSSRGDI